MSIYIHNRTITINGVVYNGFIPAFGQLILIFQNRNKIANFINTFLGISSFISHDDVDTQSITLYNNENHWIYSNKWDKISAVHVNKASNVVTCFPFNK